MTSTEARTESRSFMPVDRISGRPKAAMWSINGRLLHSPEPILYAGTSRSWRWSAASRENGVDNQVIPRSRA